jgi:PAS domain-containing protein
MAGARVIEQRSQAPLRAILDCVAVPIWLVDHEGLVVLPNPAALA